MENKKLAFLFLIYDEIDQEELWYNFFKNIDENKYSIYIHYKNNKLLKFFEKFKLKQCINTKYGDISLVRAEKLLLHEALKDKNNYKFINISQSCIPLKSFHYIYNNLTYNDFAILNESPKHQCFPRCDNLLKFLPEEQIHKCSQWRILNKKYAELISTDEEYINYFNNIYAPEEHYFISYIKNKEFTKDLVCTPNLAEGATTFINWHDMHYINEFRSKNGLKTYSEISEKELNFLLDSPCLFGRKFTKVCKVDNIDLNFFLKYKIYE